MARLNFNRRVRSSTILENLVALAIVSFSVSAALILISSMARDTSKNEFDNWLHQIREGGKPTSTYLQERLLENSELYLLTVQKKDSTPTYVELKKLRYGKRAN
jgi:type IV secretory pathway protease TraF